MIHDRKIDGVAHTVFVSAQQRFQIGLRAGGLAGARDVDVHSSDLDPYVLHVHIYLHWATWLCLGMWHLWTWWQAHRELRPLVPAGVWLRVRPW
jgi:hypothetical protein